MEYVYIVQGDTGEYSDWRCWEVAAYASKEDAEYHAEKAKQAAENLAHWVCPHCGTKYDYHWSNEQCKRASNPYDPQCSIDYTGTDYHVIAVPLLSGKVTEESLQHESTR